MTKQSSYKRQITAFLGSPGFFWGVIALLVLQAAWIALSGRYPMAFDEDFHLGIIRLYAHHLSPLWNSQPAGADAYGAVFRDPSYLYQYLMSFPYRLISVFTSDQTVQILWLRAINIGLFAGGVAIYRRLLLKTGASRAIVQGCLLLFVLIPVVPLLAAQINYDNLFIPVVGLVLLLTINFNAELARRKRINAAVLLQILILCLLGSLVKYAFLPIFLAIVIYLAVRLLQVFKSPGRIFEAKKSALNHLGRRSGLVLLVLLAISGTLFVERYGVNLVRYHTPVPDCSQSLNVEECSAYGPWSRDDYLEQHKDPAAARSPVIFAGDWFYGMWLRLFFAVDGPATNFQTKGPLVMPAISAIIFAGASVLLALAYSRRIFREYNGVVLCFLLLVSAVYVGVLWLDGYRTFLHVGEAVAINGRYLFPVLPFFMVLGALAFNELCRGRDGLKLFIGSLAVLSLFWGGGALTYILRSENSWYWPGAPLNGVNETLRRDVGPYVPGYRHPTEFMSRN